jgi:ornithine cyclodeaminase/alanine dehydrogenase
VELLYLSRADVEATGLTMREVLDAVDEGFRLRGQGRTEMPAKIGVHTRDDAFIHAMPAYVGNLDAVGMKWVSGYPGNPQHGLPYISGLLILNDANTGLPLAAMDCAWITAMRTGASVGISARYLARRESAVAGFLGCGVQARTSLAALAEELSRLQEARCFDILPAATERFIAEMSDRFPRLRFVVCSEAAEVARGSDVCVSAIPIVKEPRPPLDAGLLPPGSLAVSLDYDAAWTPGAIAECHQFITDDRNQFLETQAHGVYFQSIPPHVDADLGELAAGIQPGRASDRERIFSMNMGIAVDDIVTAARVYARAVERGIGTRLPL